MQKRRPTIVAVRPRSGIPELSYGFREQPRRRRGWIIAMAALIAIAVGAHSSSASGAAGCTMQLPAVQKAAEGVVVGRDHVRCGYHWSSTNSIEFRGSGGAVAKGWHILGSRMRTGGAAGVWIRQRGFSDDYYGCGDWRYRVTTNRGTTAAGPVSRFCAS